MKYDELTLITLKTKALELRNQILNDYQYDLVIFIARGSYLIGEVVAEDLPLIEVKASRKSSTLKKIMRPLIMILPKKLTIFLRRREMQSGVHDTDGERNIIFNEEIWNRYKKVKNIILVDDSVDSAKSKRSN